MSEKIISPGVYTRENDLSYLPTGISQVGAAFVGPTVKGPAMQPIVVTSYRDFTERFGSADSKKTFLNYAVQSYLKNAGVCTIIRILTNEGYHERNVVGLGFENTLLSLITLSTKGIIEGYTINNIYLTTGSISNNITADNFVLNIEGTNNGGNYLHSYELSFIPSSVNYITKIFNEQPDSNKPFYVYLNFQSATERILSSVNTPPIVTGSIYNDALNFLTGVSPFGNANEYMHAQTPWIISQTFGSGANAENYRLFKIHSLSDGNESNHEIKIAISDIRTPNTANNETFGSFSLSVRVYNDSDKRPIYIETFTNLSLDPNSPNFIARVIGDRYAVFNPATKKVDYYGDFPNRSKYIRVEISPELFAAPTDSVPFGFDAYYTPVGGQLADGTGIDIPPVVYRTNLLDGTEEDLRLYYGFDFSVSDNLNYLNAIPAGGAVGLNTRFVLDNLGANSVNPYNNSINYIPRKKFVVALQGGFDGINPAKPRYNGGDGRLVGNTFQLNQDYILGRNIFGLDCSTKSSPGTIAYFNAIDILSNVDEIDINLLVLPGIIQGLHSPVLDAARQMVNFREDVFFIFDCCTINDSIEQAISRIQGIDDNYSATYYPWVKIVDIENNKLLWVPPSVVIPGVIAFNDRVGYEWDGPAGLNRGGVVEVIEARQRLTKKDRDLLYENKINPLATFVGQGVAVWGQKTLQSRLSALDRINVRRLLINLKKFVSKVSKYLVFEKNIASTRNRFLSLVTPYFELVQQRGGLYAFRIQMDEKNNTPDIIDRYILKGEIFLKPTKTAEFIVIDFNIMPTGATFSE